MKTRHSINLVFSFAVLAGLGAGSFAKEPDFGREPNEWCDIWLPHTNETGLPRVLLIGDSIARAYNPEVERLLDGKAYVNRLASSAFISDPMLLEQITMVLNHYSFDIIVFNNGLHGWQHSEAEYRAGFPKLYETIQKHADGARLVWVDTTPLEGSKAPTAGANSSSIEEGPASDPTTVSDARIAARNAIAREFLERHPVSVVDIHSPMLGHPEYHTDKFHFNPTGIGIQAELIARQISALLQAE